MSVLFRAPFPGRLDCREREFHRPGIAIPALTDTAIERRLTYANSLRPKKRATPGGYGGKPPGVAIIGVPTGARNAGSGAPTGDQDTDMNGTRPTPGMCRD
jgi:hypothetical protein